jgi:diketogulonate reductase-like aldo/keto reductase
MIAKRKNALSNMAALDFELSSDDMESISKIGRPGHLINRLDGWTLERVTK